MEKKESQKISLKKRILRVILIALGILILVVGGYFIYLMTSYHRLGPQRGTVH